MTSPTPPLAMSEDAYFETLEKSLHKYEYWDGVAIAMAGAQPEHVRIQGNIFGELFQQLRGRNCLPLISEQAVKLPASRGYVFPDLTVVCGDPVYAFKRGIGCLINPTVVVEVLSPSTAQFDETEKLMAYSGIRSVREYLVVSTAVYAAKLYSRANADEIWSARVFGSPGDRIGLDSCGCALMLGEIYAGVKLVRADFSDE